MNEPYLRLKLDESDDSKYTTNLQNVGNANTYVNFKIVGLFTNNIQKNYSVAFPS
jgi:hypothetical protein